jgi:hypothetical protein
MEIEPEVLMRPLPLLLSLAVTAALSAQEAPRWGVHATVLKPSGDLQSVADAGTGLSSGVHLAFTLAPGHRLRPGISLGSFQRSSRATTQLDYVPDNSLFGSYDRKLAFAQIGVDYLYTLSPSGLYGGLGLSAERWRDQVDGRGYHVGLAGIPLDSPGPFSNTATRSTLGVNFILGYQITDHLGLELIYATSSLNSTPSALDRKLSEIGRANRTGLQVSWQF